MLLASVALPVRFTAYARVMIATRSQTATVIALCFLTILLDGYDTSVLSYVAPTLAHDWAT